MKEYLEFWRDVNLDDLLETHIQLSSLAKWFYTAVFDWKCMEFGSPSLLEDIKETYFFTRSGSLYGRFFLKNETKISPPDEKDKDTIDVHNVFAVLDIEESLELIKNGGHRKVAKTSIGPNMGYVARFVGYYDFGK
ncbi:hypothetical protein BKA61DRAFT_727166 [Leptodontidium sp. MPI-SDFR-AT-0119]|nr:hypothetical protein BKA61DRAFT_727166 [Leptodontidium sp. MPI-SDFR-AT-0119]